LEDEYKVNIFKQLYLLYLEKLVIILPFFLIVVRTKLIRLT